MANHRVLIQVTDQEISDEAISYAMSNSNKPKRSGNNATCSHLANNPPQGFYTDIDIINCTTLSLIQKDYRNQIRGEEMMYFDCVARTDSDPLVRNELSHLFDLLIIDQQSCCLVHFKPVRYGPSSFFSTILIPEVDRRLVLLGNTLLLQSIKLEYYDVQKYDVVNMFEKSKPQKSAEKSEMIFYNTRELLRWTQHALVSLWNRGSGHDCFEFEFVFVEPHCAVDGIVLENKIIKTRLSVLQFYMNKMDLNMRVGLQNFFENMRQGNLHSNQSIITDCLREYFLSNRTAWLIWLLFDVPQVNYGSLLVNDMLTLAKFAYKGSHENEKITAKYDYVTFSTPQEQSSIARQVGGLNTISMTEKLLSPNAPLNLKMPSVEMANYSLSFWYCQVEESYANVVATMDKYYDRKYDLKTQKICNELKYVTRNIDKVLQTKTVCPPDDLDGDEDELFRNCFKQYREAVAKFRILVQKIERTKYGEELNSFLNMKTNDLDRETRNMKVRLLELCQIRITNLIKDEVKNLKTDANMSANFSGLTKKITKKS